MSGCRQKAIMLSSQGPEPAPSLQGPGARQTRAPVTCCLLVLAAARGHILAVCSPACKAQRVEVCPPQDLKRRLGTAGVGLRQDKRQSILTALRLLP